MREDVAEYVKKCTDKILMEANITDREYCPEGEYPDGEKYPFWDETLKKQYNATPAKLSDEELEMVLNAYRLNKDNKTTSNLMATVLKGVGTTLLIVGILVIVAWVSESRAKSEIIPLAIAFGVGIFITFILFLAIAEIITLLDAIKNK